MQQFDFQCLGFTDITHIASIYTGLASTNFHIQCQQGNFLIKIIKDKDPIRCKKLSNNLNATQHITFGPCFLWHKQFNDMNVFVFKWIEGGHILLNQLTLNDFKSFLQNYMSFISKINQVDLQILPPFDLKDQFNRISAQYPFIEKNLKQVQQDLPYQPKLQIIHGDFHFKNILFHHRKLQAFLDFEAFCKGCPTEDLMYLLISNAERKLFHRKKTTLKLLQVMLEELPFNKQDWLYGLDVYIIKRYVRKLSKSKLSVYKRITLWRNSILYQQIRDFINSYHTQNTQ